MKTKVTPSRIGSPSLRTTIPEGYAQLLRLKPGDELEWDHEITGGEIVLRIRKL